MVPVCRAVSGDPEPSLNCCYRSRLLGISHHALSTSPPPPPPPFTAACHELLSVVCVLSLCLCALLLPSTHPPTPTPPPAVRSTWLPVPELGSAGGLFLLKGISSLHPRTISEVFLVPSCLRAPCFSSFAHYSNYPSCCLCTCPAIEI